MSALNKTIFAISLAIICCQVFCCPQHEVETHNKTPKALDSNNLKLICYYGSWSVYRPMNGKFTIEQIDPFLCSHLIYAFAGLGSDNKIRPLDPYNDLRENYGKGAYERFNKLKDKNKNLKTLIAIGGWNEGSIKYSNMASQPEARRTFVDSVVAFISKYGFDGLDLDWEYPSARGGKPEDKNNFVHLLRELKEALSARGYILSAAVSAGKWFIDPAYDIPQVSQYLDIINVMCYDYHGGWENRTGHNSPLYARPDEVDLDRISNVNFSINYWISRGAPKSKIVMGMGTYGRSFTLQRAENREFGAAAPQKGQAGPYTREAGSLGYNEICEMRMKQQWTEVRDPHHLAPYAYKDRQWVGFDDIESLTLKSQYIKAMGLAGGMIWSIETDDFLGKCGPAYPLLNAINRVFKEGKVEMPMPGATPEAAPVPSSSTTSTATPSWSKPSSASTTSTASTHPWVWAKPNATISTPTSTSTTTTSTTSTSTTTTTQSPSSSTTRWPWAATHPTEGFSSTQTSTKREQTWSTPTSTSTTESENDANSFTCTHAGMFRHPNDCQKFFRCVPTINEGKYHLFEYKCPERTVFNRNTNLCDWAFNVVECSRDRAPPKPTKRVHLPTSTRKITIFDP